MNRRVRHSAPGKRLSATTQSHKFPMKIKDDVWEAEKLIRRRLRNGRFEYLVKWRNYTIRQSTWEPEENILDSHLLSNFNSALDRDVRVCGIRGVPSVRGRRRKRHINRHYPWPKPTKRRRHSESENRRPENSTTPRPRGRPRGRPRIRPLLTPIRDTNQHVGEEEIDDVVDEAIRLRSVEGVRLGSSQVPLSALRQRSLVLTDVTYEGVTVTIKEDIGHR